MIIEKELLQQIINIIFVNLQREKKTGLLKGKMGIIILLYHYARYSENNQYKYFPEEYMCIVEKFFSIRNSKNMVEEIAENGWGIDYLIKNGFIEADEDVLEEVDLKVDSEVTKGKFLRELEAKLPLFSKGLYFLQRGKFDVVKESLLEVINLIKANPRLKLPLLYINSIIYTALVSSKLDSELDSGCYDELLNLLYESVIRDKCIKIEDQDYFLIKKNISLMPEYQISKWNNLIPEQYKLNDIHDCYWIDFLFPEGERIPVDTEKINIWLKAFLQNFDCERLSIYKGLSGVGLALMNKLAN